MCSRTSSTTTCACAAGASPPAAWDRREIDFVATRQEEALYVQVAYLLTDEATHAREFGNLLDIPDNYPKLVVSMGPVIGASHKGIGHLHVREFLSREW